jgi:DNA-directed RNA polymerase subunit K/omega
MTDEIKDEEQQIETTVPEESPDTPESAETESSDVVEEPPGNTIPTSTYEMVVVAAREARRLNNRLRRLADERPEKVTTRAIERVLAGQVRFAYDDDTAGA